jgi:hypothetical protein
MRALLAAPLLLLIASAATAARAEGPPAVPPGEPQPASESEADRAERLRLEAQIARELGSATATATVTGPAQAAPAPPAPGATGASPYARLLAMPDLAAVVSFAGAWNDYDVEFLSPRSGPFAPGELPAFLLQEVELSLRSVIDPYGRAEIYLSIGPGGASVEEAFLTTTALPAGFQLKAGQFLSPFGRLNAQHPHTWDFVDAPLALDRLLAREALSGPGVDLSWLAPLPWFAELQLSAQSTATVEGDPSWLTGIARLAQFFSLTEETTLGLGLSGGVRNPGADGRETFSGADLYVRWRPPAARRAATFQAEILRRQLGVGAPERWGGYAQLFWRAGPSAGLGVRYDQAPTEDGAEDERRYSAVATWFLSEFQRLRLQIGQDRRPDGQGIEALVQAEFGIGAHGAHPF